MFGKHVLTAYNAARADALDTAFSKYPHLWAAMSDWTLTKKKNGDDGITADTKGLLPEVSKCAHQIGIERREQSRYT